MKHIKDDELYGLQVTNTITPCTSKDKYATHDSQYGRGGWHEVNTIDERNNIPADRRRDGMACYVKETGKVYILNGYAWNVFTGADGATVKDIVDAAIAAGDITLDVDLTQYLTKTEFNKTLEDYAKISDLDSINEKTGDLQDQVDTKASEEDLNNLKNDVNTVKDSLTALSEAALTQDDWETIATKEELNNYVTNEAYGLDKEAYDLQLESVNTEITNIKENYASKEFLTEQGYINSEILDTTLKEAGFIDEDTLNNKLVNGEYVVKDDLTDYATLDDVKNTIDGGNFLKVGDLKGYATEAWVSDTINNSNFLKVGDLRGYATEAWVEDYVNLNGGGGSGSGGTVDLTSYVKKTELTTELLNYYDKNTSDGRYAQKVDIPGEYVLPVSSTSVLGGVKVDGTTITVNDGVITAHVTSEGDNDYSTLNNKPQINGIELIGNKSLTELGIQAAGDYLIEADLTGYAKTSEIPTATSDLTNDSGFITNTVDNLTNYTPTSGLAAVATSGSFEDLTHKPVIPSIYILPTASTSVLGGVKVDGTTVTIEDGVITAHATSTGGTSDYSTLTNKPQIGGVELTGNKSLTDLGIQPAGTYLTEIPAEYVTETELNGKGYLTAVPAEYVTETELNGKGYITSAALEGYAQSSDIPTATSDLTNDSGFITNSVNNLTNYTLTSGLAAVATSGSYNDLSNKPTIITSYNDLTDKPSIPSAYVLPTASTTTLGGVKVDGTTVTISGGVISAPAANIATTSTAGVVKPDDVTIGIKEDGTLVNNSAGCNCYIYGVNGIGSDDITIAADTTTTISTGRLRNFNEGAGNRIKVGDVLIDVKGNVAKIDRVNTAPVDPDEWLFGVDESSVLIKLQLREDETLTTTSKEIVGAINELLARIASLEARVTELEGGGS